MKTNPKNTSRWIGRTARGALLGLLCVGGVAWGQAEAVDEDALFADPLDVFFEDFKVKREHIHTIQARFTETTSLPDEAFVATGRMVYTTPRRLVRWGEEPPTVLLVEHQTVYEYEPELKQVARYDISDGPEAEILFFGFDKNLDTLRATYDVRLFELDEEGPQEDGKNLLITPKPIYTEDTFFREVALYLRAEDYLPFRIRIVTDEDSHVVLDIRDIVVNGPLTEADSTLTIPEGHTYVDERERAQTVGPEGLTLPLPEDAPVPESEAAEDNEVQTAPLSTVTDLPAPGATE